MLPEPLHPAIVHLPIALAVILPLFGLASLWAIRSGWLPLRAWSAVVVLAALLVAGSWAALETGEHEEETVERVVAERAIEAHEEAAEVFSVLALVVLAASVAGLRGGRFGNAARITACVLMLGLLVAGARVGHLGGELVYTHGAAGAYVDPPSKATADHG